MSIGLWWFIASNSLTEALFNMYEVSVQGQPEGKAKKVPNLTRCIFYIQPLSSVPLLVLPAAYAVISVDAFIC